MLRAVILFCVVLAVRGQTTDVSQCTANPGPLPINAYIAGCGAPPCNLPQLQDAVINIIFRAPNTIRTMRTLAVAYIPSPLGNIPFPYGLGDNAETCNFLTNTYCPVVQGEVIQYTLRMYIESFFPVDTQVSIEFRIVDEANSPVMCIRVPIRITAPETFGARNSTLIGEA
ncbi:uncharacterized protein LOC124639669 [Helicoverpa zea]|uniref:uncharacterized protein LOC124639669 n=1 Tax=Helicoverpa zea TaxID=7113 RepID=UPI001F579FEC|nr:uncharacterized protein LOC124639669 [Helicoverpa zea]